MHDIRPCDPGDLGRVFQIINNSAQAYRGAIPSDRWKELNTPRQELEHEISQRVRSFRIEADDVLGRIMSVKLGNDPEWLHKDST
jgi:hypothetical protein